MGVIELDGREYPPEAVWRAQELYCVARLTYAQVAEELGVAVSTLKRWGAQYGWPAKRAELARAMADIRADTVLARSAMLKELIEERNPAVGFAVAKLEELALKQAQAQREGRAIEEATAAPRRAINNAAEAAAALREAIELKLARLLSSPEEVDLKAVKAIKDAMELIGQMEPKTKGAAQGKGLSPESIQRIQREILGL